MGLGATLSDLEETVCSELQRDESLVKEQKDQPGDMWGRESLEHSWGCYRGCSICPSSPLLPVDRLHSIPTQTAN